MCVMLQSILRVFLFFFSSRRRHTRFDCDWSSDVCSSDLKENQEHIRKVAEAAKELAKRETEERSEEHTSELQSQSNLVCRLLLEKKKAAAPRRDEALDGSADPSF